MSASCSFNSSHPSLADPWQAAATWGEKTVLAVLVATEGPSYRDPGAAIAFHPDGKIAGTITSGCIEADLQIRAESLRGSGKVERIRYGQGSPFFDLQLPCGGAVEILLFSLLDASIVETLVAKRSIREPVSLAIEPTGRMQIADYAPTGFSSTTFTIGFPRSLRFYIFGTGAEVVAFTGAVRSLGYDHCLYSHDEECLDIEARAGTEVRFLNDAVLRGLAPDNDSAVVLFYHNHDYEAGILRQMLKSSAFYIGAQGSRAVQVRRLVELEAAGIVPGDLARLRGPIGLIPSSRDARSLAISVLAEVLAEYKSGERR
jgi:xanthine dehydrogenase accessory factor